MSNILCTCSKQSALRFIQRYLSLNDTPYWFHQTLTLGEHIDDLKSAKRIFEKLLDSLEVDIKKRFEIGAIFIMGRQASLRVHFHVIFVLFGPQSLSVDQTAEVLRKAVWKRWKKLSKGANKEGNWLTVQNKADGLHYLLKEHFKIAKTSKAGMKPLWNGVRNRPLLAANSTPVSKVALRETFKKLFPKPRKAVRRKHIFTKTSLEYMKAYVETKAVMDWDTFKRTKTGRNGKVSDADYLAFLNGNGRKIRRGFKWPM